MFLELRKKYGTWRTVCRELHICMRALFGLRRGYNYEAGKKVLRFLRIDILTRLCQMLGVEPNSVQGKIKMIEIGNRRDKISFPLSLKLNEDVLNLKRSVLEFVYSSEYERSMPTNSPFAKQGLYNVIDFKSLKCDAYERMKMMSLQGLKPSINLEGTVIRVSYRVPGTNRRTTATLPKKIVFDEKFAKEFGKWMGDRAGGPHKVGVSNKEFNFIKDFKRFLSECLLQPRYQGRSRLRLHL